MPEYFRSGYKWDAVVFVTIETDRNGVLIMMPKSASERSMIEQMYLSIHGLNFLPCDYKNRENIHRNQEEKRETSLRPFS